MKVISTAIPDVKLIMPDVFQDDRGFFYQAYHESQYKEAGIDATFVQDNRSRSTCGTLRGLHYQLTHPQDKLVSVSRGKVVDVAVDIRKSSSTFGKYVSAILSDENHHQLFVPKGFAHGFCVLSDEVDFSYKCSDFYTAGDDYGIRWDDPQINIYWHWPRVEFIMSPKDKMLPFLTDIPSEHLFD